MEYEPDGARGRVLLITKTDFAEPRDGGTLRVSAVVNALRSAGFSVDSVATRSADGTRHPSSRLATPWFKATADGLAAAIRVLSSVLRVGSVSVARWYSPASSARIAFLLRRNEYCAVLIEYSQLLVYRGLVRELPVILDMHNVEHELLANYACSAESILRRLIARYETSRVRRLEQRARRLTTAIVTVSTRDAESMRLNRGAAVVVTATNGVSESAFDVVRTKSADPTVVFIGLLGWQPNVDAAHWLVQRVWPGVTSKRPDAQLQLIGRSPAKSLMKYHGSGGISIHPDVPSTLPYLGAAAVATAPLRAAGGTRLKILEAMATGTPVVATGLGAMGLEHLAHDGAMEIAEDPDRFAEAIVRFIDSRGDPERARRAVDAYRWTRALEPLVDVISESVQNSENDGRRANGSRILTA